MAGDSQASPEFYLSFDDNTADAVTHRHGIQKPLQEDNLRFVNGVRGSAIFLGKEGEKGSKATVSLKYAADNLFSSDSGTVSFWVKPDWDGFVPWGADMKRDYRFFAAFARDESDGSKTVERKMWLWMWNWLRCDLKSADQKPEPNLQWRSRNTWMKGDWWHVAVTWGKSDGRRLYLNGIPVYRRGQVNLDGITDFLIGGESQTQLVEAAFDEFKIYSRQLSRREIESQFREFSPLNFTLERRFLRAGIREQVSIEVSHSQPSVDAVKLALEIVSDTDNKVIRTWRGEIAANTGRTINLPLDKLEVGDYRLRCLVKTGQGNWQRSFPLTVYQQREPAVTSAESLKLGECLVDIDLTTKANSYRESVPSTVKDVQGVGRYLELGDKKWDRIAVELPKFKASRSPLVVEIEWPDDRERSMSFYLFVESKRKQHRDRLSGGVQSGGEYLNSGKMKKTRYLFYPESDSYLFEVRTLIDGLPAAVSRLKIYALAERLPKLVVNLPTNLPLRNVGHLDEDQSFEVLMSPHSLSPSRGGYAIQVIENLLDYNDYTGQNTISYPVLRYSWSHLDTAPVNKVGNGLRVAGWISLLMDMMAQRDQSFFPAINLYTIAGDVDQSPVEQNELIKQGHFLYNSSGNAPIYGSPLSYGNNPVHPAVKAKFLSQIDEIARRFGYHSAFKGINLWLHTPAFFNSLDQGYGDYTIAVFEKETGISIPVSSKGQDRFQQRYRYLTGAGKREWLDWRVKTNLTMIKEVNSRLQRAKKGARLYLNLNRKWQQPRYSKGKTIEGFDLKAFCFREYAMDIDAIDAIDFVSIAPLKGPTESRSNKHWDHGAQNLNFELMTDINIYRPFRGDGQGVASLYYVYVESFMNSLSAEKYASYFQNSDPKAAGRDFLAGYSIAMASQNPETIFAGAQPLGTMGREEVSREFIRNFRALPAGSYEDMPSMIDPVTARSWVTPNGTYFYQVNLLPWSVETEIQFPNETVSAKDLGEGVDLKLEEGKLKQTLKPFQLRAYLIPGQQVKPQGGTVTLEQTTRQWFADQQKVIAESVAYLKKWNGEFELAGEMEQKIGDQIKAGYYADAYRRINSRAIRVLPQLIKEAVKTTPFFSDKFEDPQESGKSWDTGKALIKDGPLIVGNGKTNVVKLKNNPEGDVVVDATIFAQGDGKGWGGISFRGAKLLLRKDGFWVNYRVNGSDKTQGKLVKANIKPGKEYQFKILNRGSMYIFYVDGEKLQVVNEAKGLQGSDEGLILASYKYLVGFKQVKLSQVIDE